MTKKIIIAIGMLAIAAAGFLLYDRIDSPDVPEDARLPATVEASALDFSLPDLAGAPRQLSEWQGKARIVNFWATWCAPCRREIPLLKRTQEAHAGDNLQIIGVAVDFQDEVVAYAEEAQFNYPILIGQEEAMAAAEASGVEFIGMPFTLIVSPDGQLLNAHMGEILESHIDTIMQVFGDLGAGKLTTSDAREALADM